MKKQIIDDIKKFNWKKIIQIGNNLSDLNENQWRFLKATIIESAIEKYGVNGIKYVHEDHRDFAWSHHKVDVEVKSVLSSSMYKKNGFMRKNFNIMFSNSMGTNKKSKPDKKHVADIILCIYNDGCFVVDGKKYMDYMKSNGDGFTLSIDRDEVIEISGKISTTEQKFDIKNLILEKIKEIL